MHGGYVNKQLPARPNLEHLRGQAKTLKRSANLKLTEAQSRVARQAGFKSWKALVHHVETLRALEGEWQFDALEVAGEAYARDVFEHSRILIDGDRFRTESPEATYEGILRIDAEASPAHIDIEFVAGPEAGNTSHGIFVLDGDSLTLCLGLVGASRPQGFATRAGSNHALEKLRRASKARPANVTGGTPPPPEPEAELGDPADFAVTASPLLRKLAGEWAPVELVMDGKPMPKPLLAHGTRTMTGNEIKVVFGGQTMVHAKVRIDDSVRPIAIDYFALAGKSKGKVTHGILEWIGDDMRTLMAPLGRERPCSFEERGTLSRWRKK